MGSNDNAADVVVRTAGLVKHYGATVALDGLDLELRAGEVFGFLGPNGAGKTTTVKLLLGLVRPTRGEAWLFDQPVAANLPSLLERVGAMVEAPAFYPFLSGRDNLQVLAKIAGIAPARIEASLEAVGLLNTRQKFGAYSIGMKQRLGIAAVLLRDPALVILDEPTNGLDPAGQRDVDALISRLAGEGRTVVLCSHSMNEVEQVCDRVAIMKSGRVVAGGRVSELMSAREGIELRVPNPATAATLIESLPGIMSVEIIDGLVVVGAPFERAGEISAALAGAGHFVSELRARRRSIESVYFEAVGEREAA
jgi:ABC-2 type transport system ATP-binding protein